MAAVELVLAEFFHCPDWVGLLLPWMSAWGMPERALGSLDIAAPPGIRSE